MATLLNRIRRSVHIDEERLAGWSEWMADSIHQHIDDLTRYVCAALVTESAREWAGTVIAIVVLGSSIAALAFFSYSRRRIHERHTHQAAIVKDSDPDYQAFCKLINSNPAA